MRLKSGDLEHVTATLLDLKTDGENVIGSVGGPYADPRGTYLDWVDKCEAHLGSIFVDRATVLSAHTERYWQIASVGALDRLAQMVMAEVRYQLLVLEEMVDQIKSYRELRDRVGLPVVVDTNVLLHYQRIDRVPWSEVAEASQVRLVVLHAVLDELDDKRYLGSASIRERARSATAPLDERQAELEVSGIAMLPDGTTIEYLSDDRGHVRDANPDDEILSRAEFLSLVTGQRVLLVTGDRGLRVRTTASSERVRARLMPVKFARDRDEAGSTSD